MKFIALFILLSGCVSYSTYKKDTEMLGKNLCLLNHHMDRLLDVAESEEKPTIEESKKLRQLVHVRCKAPTN